MGRVERPNPMGTEYKTLQGKHSEAVEANHDHDRDFPTPMISDNAHEENHR